jgi:hypothetical protein
MAHRYMDVEDITDPKLIKILLHLWKYDRHNNRMKTYPCSNGIDCTTDRCPFAHVTYRGATLVRCKGCVNRTCRHSTLYRTTMWVGKKKEPVVRVCRSVVEDLEERLRHENARRTNISPSPPKEPPVVSPMKILPPVILEHTRIAIKQEVGVTIAPDYAEVIRKRERPDEEFPIITFAPTRNNYRALANMIRNPNFKGVVQIPTVYIVETLTELSAMDVLALDPNFLPDTPEIHGLLKNAAQMQKNLDLHEHLMARESMLKKARLSQI